MIVKVLITGAGALLGQGIFRALERSSLAHETVMVDPSVLSPGLFWADKGIRIPRADDPRYLDELKRILGRERPAVVLVGTDVELPVLANRRLELEREFDLKILVSDARVVSIADDKYRTYEFLRDAGLDPPETRLAEQAHSLVETFGFPLIVKPRVGARSQGLSLVNSPAELASALAQRSGLIVQEHIGTAREEYTASALVFDGVCRASIVMRRDLRDGNTFRAYSGEFADLNPYVRVLGEALRPHGPANFQFRLDDRGRPRVFEINARFSGTTPLRALVGFNEVEMCLRHVLHGEPIVQPRIESATMLRYWSELIVRDSDIAAIT